MDTPYDRWVSSQGIHVFKGYLVENVLTIPLKSWERFGGYGIIIHLEGTGYLDDAFVLSILPGAGTSTILFELADATMGSHVSEFEVPYCKKAHRHGPPALM